VIHERPRSDADAAPLEAGRDLARQRLTGHAEAGPPAGDERELLAAVIVTRDPRDRRREDVPLAERGHLRAGDPGALAEAQRVTADDIEATHDLRGLERCDAHPGLEVLEGGLDLVERGAAETAAGGRRGHVVS
jgi:hypothetical protein